MKICIISHEYPPFPGGGIATYHAAAAAELAAAGHEVHIVTNRATWGRTESRHTERLWRENNVTVHRLKCFDEQREPPREARFFDVNPREYRGDGPLWAQEVANLTAHRVANFVELLHDETGLDVIETPEYFAEAFYIIRCRRSGDRHRFPPVCVHGHTSSRFAFGSNRHVWELGYPPHRQRMLREEYCVRNADALITPSRSLMTMYEERFAGRLPKTRAVIPYFLNMPEEPGQPPAELGGGRRYLVCIGRIEPRKGSDLVLRAFARLASEHDDLLLAFLGSEMWHHGEKFENVINALVPPAHRNRVLRLGNVPREQALAAARDSVAFVHAAPWDNYPCAVLEAMAAGAVCVVSDSGGHAEMVEHERSGLVFPAEDAEALIATLRRVVAEPGLKATLAEGGRARVDEITDAASLAERKVEVFEAMIDQERARPTEASQFDLPVDLQADPHPPTLAGRGVLVIDAGGATQEQLDRSTESVVRELRGSEWEIVVLCDPGQGLQWHGGWRSISIYDAPPWTELADAEPLALLRAGVALDWGSAHRLVTQLFEGADECGAFLWLRPPTAEVFPYRPDFGVHDLLVAGLVVPPAFAVRARALRRCRSMAGLFEPDHRLATLMATAVASGSLTMRHAAGVCGDYYRELPIMTDDLQARTVGHLDRIGALDPSAAVFGARTVHRLRPTPEEPPPPAPAKSKKKPGQPGQAQKPPGGGGGQGKQGPSNKPAGGPVKAPAKAGTINHVAKPPAPTSAVAAAPSPSVDNGRLAELERVYREHQALKQMKVVKAMRRLGLFSMARTLFPRAKRAIGGGRAAP
ncbi:MAG: glycosyltransferase family 4 protein [Planctomycetota bacterium]